MEENKKNIFSSKSFFMFKNKSFKKEIMIFKINKIILSGKTSPLNRDVCYGFGSGQVHIIDSYPLANNVKSYQIDSVSKFYSLMLIISIINRPFWLVMKISNQYVLGNIDSNLFNPLIISSQCDT